MKPKTNLKKTNFFLTTITAVITLAGLIPSAFLIARAADFDGTMIISSATLSFNAIPESFTFGTVTSGPAQDLFNNNNTTAAPTDSSPGADLLQVLDDRDAGGFTVTVDAAGTFTDGTNTIPVNNLYVVTSLDETDPENGDTGSGEEAGITYDSGVPSADRNIVAPVYVDVDSLNLDTAATFTDLSPDSRFGSGPVVLMNGTMDIADGRDGTFSQFVSFYLIIPALQTEGKYDLTLTYTLTDSTT